MNAIAQLPTLSTKQIALVRSTIAKDCSSDEFDLFVQAAQSYGLDPFRKQISPIVFNKNNPSKRQMAIVINRDGHRVMAARCGDYRPASEPAEFDIDESRKGTTNPAGLVSCRVRLWKQDRRSGEWFPVSGEAYWDEFVPLKREWIDDPESGRGRYGDGQTLDATSPWARMPRLMLQKVAEAQALRAGWPETFGGVYFEGELDRAEVLDLTATEIVEHEKAERRQKAIASLNSIPLTFGDRWGLEFVDEGRFADRILEWAKEKDRTGDEISAFRSANSESLRQFWAKHPADALELKRELEAVEARLDGKAAA